MRYPQLVVYETDQRLATWMREAVDIAEKLRYGKDGQLDVQRRETDQPLRYANRAPRGSNWLLHEARRPSACMRLLENGGPAVLIIQLANNVSTELDLLERATRLHPAVSAIIVGEEAHRSLAPLAWDLGASAVLFPPRVGERLQEIVSGIMQSVTVELFANVSNKSNDEGHAQ